MIYMAGAVMLAYLVGYFGGFDDWTLVASGVIGGAAGIACAIGGHRTEKRLRQCSGSINRRETA